jgi:hypothetical protein
MMTPTAPTLTPTPGATTAGRAPAGDIPVQDWQGLPLDCAACPHADLRASLGVAEGCEPGHSCMQDAYARRIDRFFRAHRSLTNQHLAHPYFEVRAIAARYADLFHLSPLLRDEDETVRLQVALRVPQRQLLSLCEDPHREVRIRVAQRLDESQLSRLMQDPDYEVRTVLARRLPVALLPLLAADRDTQVRRAVAERIEMPAMWRMAEDAAPEVRRIVARRLPPGLLTALACDEDWGVRWQVAERLDAQQHAALLARLAEDEDSEVRTLAASRLRETTPAATPAATPTATLVAWPSTDSGDSYGRHQP